MGFQVEGRGHVRHTWPSRVGAEALNSRQGVILPQG